MIQRNVSSYRGEIHLRHIFKAGLMIEERAASYYASLADKAANPDAKDLCCTLIQRRISHIQLIEQSLSRWVPLLLGQEAHDFFDQELRNRGIFSGPPSQDLSKEAIARYAIDQGNKIVDFYRSFEDIFSDTWKRSHILELLIEERNRIKELTDTLKPEFSYSAKAMLGILMALLFLFSSTAFAIPEEKTTDPGKISISRENGLVRSSYNANSDKLIINIQDAHCNYEAQVNIAKMVEGLAKNYGLSFVAIEGADGEIDVSKFDAFTDEAVRREVADHFMRKGDISGPEFLSVTTKHPIKLFGAETGSYYNEDLLAFTSGYLLKPQADKYLYSIKVALNNLKEFIYSDELKLLDAKGGAYDAKKMAFNDYVRFLQDEAEKNNVSLKGYENFFKLVNILKYEKNIDFEATDKERTALLEALSAKLSKEGVVEMVTRSISFKLGKISAVEYYGYLKEAAANNGMDISGRYPDLSRYIIYNSVYNKIDNGKLFDDIRAVKAAISEKIFRSNDQRMLEKLSRHADILIGLVSIDLMNNDLEYYNAHKDEFASAVFSSFIKDNALKYGLKFNVEPFTNAAAEGISRMEHFYAVAVKRDKALVENTLNEMNRNGHRIAVLVTGGFHSEGVAKLLAKAGVSYIVVSPSITKEMPSPYIQVLTNQRDSFEAIAIGSGITALGRGALAPPPLTGEMHKEAAPDKAPGKR